MTTVEIQQGTWRDAEGVFNLRDLLDSETAMQTGIPKDDSPDMAMSQFYDTLGWFYDQNKVVYVARADKQVIGYIAVMAATYIGRTSGISAFGYYVLKDYRNTTAGARLLKTAIQSVVQTNQKRAQAVVMLDNSKMLSGMMRMGFKPVAMVFDKELHNGFVFRKQKGSPVLRSGREHLRQDDSRSASESPVPAG